jgi:hypothetical protein
MTNDELFGKAEELFVALSAEFDAKFKAFVSENSFEIMTDVADDRLASRSLPSDLRGLANAARQAGDTMRTLDELR